MLPTGQETQPPCPYTLQHIITKQTFSLSLTLGITSAALVLLLLLHIARHYHRPATATYLAYHHLSQMDAMEKGTTSPMTITPPPQSQTPPPPSSACDVLKPLSQSGVFPSSGAVAARARELMQMQMQTGKASPSSPGMVMGGSAMMESGEAEVAAEGGSRRSSNSSDSNSSGGGEVGGSVQKRGELVQQIREVDGRTWRRVVTEYS